MDRLYRRKANGPWHADYTGSQGKRIRKSTGTTVRKLAEKVLAKWAQEAIEQQYNIGDGKSSIDELVAEYLTYLGNTGDKHRDHTAARLKRMLDQWQKPDQITQYGVETIVRQLVDEKTGRKLALRTQNHYIACAKSFTRWLVNVRHALAKDPLVAAKKAKFDADRQRIRRFLHPDEWVWLARTPNAVLYETAIQTGLRASELLSLKPEHLRSDHVLLPAQYTKNKTTARQYVTPGLRAKLAKSLPFQVPDIQRLAKLLRADLQIARELHLEAGPSNKPIGFLQPKDIQGHILDFHSLRHTCGAWLAVAGVNPKVIQSVMRHSSIALTLDIYGHLFPGVELDAVQHFARFMDR